MQGKNIFATRWGIIGVGAVIGILAPVLQKLGNPGNMGICVACFERDIAGSLGLHRAEVVQYLRPEIIGFVIGALIAAYLFKEFRPRAGSAPIVRFVLGAFAMIGALVFLGCPWRAMLRLAGGDGNAILGLLGLTFGIWVGT
ncbi:MAG: YedE family putative selenium transporter, partial [Desulfatitalea sp.]